MTNSPEDSNIRSAFYDVARNTIECWHCRRSTDVVAVVVPVGHETLEEAEAEAWQRCGADAFLFYIAHINASVRYCLRALSADFRLTYSDATANSYWANHCRHCLRLLEDHELHCEPGGAFVPTSEIEASYIRLLRVDEALQTLATGYALAPEFRHYMRRA